MNRSNRRNYYLYILLILLAMVVVWYFGLEEEHGLKTRIKAFIRAVT